MSSSLARKLIAWLPTHVLYWIGLIAFWPINLDLHRESEEPPRWWHWCYRVYNGCMVASWRLNEWGALNVWRGESNISRKENLLALATVAALCAVITRNWPAAAASVCWALRELEMVRAEGRKQ